MPGLATADLSKDSGKQSHRLKDIICAFLDFANPSDINALKAVQTMQLGVQYLQFTLSQTREQLAKTRIEN